jgi:hypothetical protein
MGEMIERVAMAIFRNGIGELVWSSGSDEQHEAAFRQARAAIEAMREPTDEMMDAGREKTNWGPHGTDECWRAMIDATLPAPPSQEEG